MKYSNTVEYNISTKLDSSGLTKLQSQIKQLENSMQQMSNRNIINEEQVKSAKTQLEGLNSALTNSFNSSLGILDLSKFRAELDKSGVSATGLQSAFSMMGAEGQAALNGLTTQIANFNGGMERTSSAVDKIFTTFSNTFRWGMVSSFFSQFMNAIHSSIDYVKELDDSLTQIMLVTDYNRDSMNEFARSANEAAKAVSMTTTGMTNASLIFAQQGYDLGRSQELATLSAKVANASQQDTATTSDQITAYMNAYGLENSIGELTQAMDNWALIANISAADVGELAQASQRAASMANAVGVSGEQLASQIATIESVTREAPEQIGNGLKTLYARFSDIAAGGEDEDGFTLGKVTSQLQAIGVQIFDQMGQIRDVGDIMEDLMVIWDDLDQTSKVAASQALAGKYQVNRFMALMDNSDMYQEYKGATGANAAGTLDMMNEEYAQSIEGRSAKMQASLEGLFSTIFNTDDIYPWMDAAQGAVDLLQEFFDALGGGKTVLLGITSLLGQAFSQNMARSINDMIANQNLGKIREQNINGVNNTLDRVGIDKTQGVGAYISATANQAKLGALNDTQYDTYMNNVQQWADASTALAKSEEQLTDNVNAVNLVFGKIAGTTDAAKLTDKGLDTFGAADERAQWTNQSIAKKAQEVDFSDVSDQSRLVANTLKEVQEELQKSQEGFLDSQKSAESLEQTLDKLGDQLSVLSDEMQGYNSSAAEKMRENLENIREELKQSGEVSEGSTKQVQKYITEMEHLSNTAANMDETVARKIMNDAGDSAQQLQGNVNFNKIQEQRAAANAQESQADIDYQQEIKGVLDTLNAVQQLTFAWQSFQNLGSLWANEDLSTGEKVLQTIMNLTIALPQLINGLQNLQGMGGVLSKVGGVLLKPVEAIGNFNKEIGNIKEIANQGKIAKEALDSIGAGLATTAEAGAVASQEMLKELVEASAAGDMATESFMGMNGVIGKAMAEAAATGAGGLGVLGAAAKAALIEFWPFLLIGGAIAAIGFAIGQEAEKAKQAKEEALEAFDEAQAKLEEMQSIREQALSFNDKFESKKASGEGFEGLADEAKDLADALVEAGHASESAEIRLAATKAAALGTEEAYQELADTVKTASLQAEMDTNTDAQRAAMDVLNTQKADLDEIAQKQATLRDLKEQLNSLDQEDSRRGVLEDRIKELEDYISKNQEAVEAANQLREAQAANVGLQLSQETSDTVHSSGIDDATKRAGTYQEYAGTYDYDTLSAIYSKNVADWDKYSELEKIDIMLHTLQDDAQIAAVEIEQILQSNSSLKDMGYAGQAGPTAEEQRDNITGALENTGLSAEQNLQLMATFDKDATYNEIMDGIREIQQGLENDEDFDVLLKAKFDPEQIKEGVKTAVDAYEPTDEDVDADQFKSMANYIEDADASAFEEGGALEDISPDIQNNAEALEQLVEGILRYDDAISTLSEKEEDWRDALSDSSSLADRVEAIGELKETYSDFLDLGADVSDSFAENTHNLDLMAEAAAGDTAAYNELLAAASEDIAINVYGVDESSAALQQMSDYLQSPAFQDVEVGMAINDDAFYDALNRMSADANWTAADMEAYLSDIGCSIDPSGFEETANSLVEASDQTGKAEAKNLEVTTTTEVESDTASQSDTTEYTSAIANVTHETGTSILPATAGNLGTLSGGQQPTPVEIPYDIPSVEYTAVPITKTDIQEKTGYAVNTKAEQGGGGAGGVQVKKGSVKKNNSGGAKNNHSSGGGGGGGKGGSCFVTGTLVTTLTGFSPIEQIKQGDIVLSYNESLYQLEYSVVVQTMIHDVIEPIYTIHIKDEQLRVTGIHRFLISHDIFHSAPQWIPAADLQIGDWMFLADGTWHLIHNIEVNVEHQIVYNFEVAGNHNYYVGRNQILAHNKGGKKSCFVAGTPISMTLGYKPIELIKPDDFVLSYNESLHQNEYSRVVQTMIHDTKEPIYTLYIKDEQLRVTGIHRFLISKDINFKPQWIAAQDLQIGDWVLLADGTWHLIWKIEINIEKQVVYNFEVAGNHNYYVGKAQILAHNKGGKGGSGKKGGGGGKAKTIEPKEKKEHKKDYYEEVSNQLDKTEKILSKIEKEEDRLIGDKARANQNKQLTLLQKEIDLNKDKLKIQKQELKDVDNLIKKRDKLAEKTAAEQGVLGLIPDMQLDEDGIVSNYEQISEEIDKIHNQLIDKYNAAAAKGDEELTKKIQKSIDKFDKYGEDLLKQIQRHNKLQSEIETTTEEIESLNDAIEDIRIDAYKASQEALDELKDIQEEAAKVDKLFRNFDSSSFMNSFSIDDTSYGDLIESLSKIDNMYAVTKDKANDFYNNLINQKKKQLAATKDDDERKALQSSIDFFKERMKNTSNDELQNGLLGLSMQDLERLQGWIDGTNKEKNPFGENTAALYEAYDDARKRTLELFEDYREIVQDARDSIIDIYDEQEDALDRVMDKYDRLTDKLERIGDTYQLYYGEDSYEEILSLMQQQGDTMKSQLDQLTNAYQHWYSQYQLALATGDKKLIEEIEDKMNDAEDAMLDKAEELAELWVEKFEKSVEANTKSISDKLLKGNDFDNLESRWELQKDYMDRYKDEVEKTYEIEKLRSKYNDLLNDAQGASLQTQNKIRKQMQEQLKQLQDQASVSEYDVKLANAKLQILQKQIALEDAQRNKNQMQLRRDSQGNYRYVYRAKQEDVKAAQDELLDSEFDAYELTKDETISNNDRALTLVQDFLSKRADIFNKYKDDDVARAKALEELSADYSKLLAGMEEDFKDTTNGMYDVLTFMVQNGTEDTATTAATMLDELFEDEGKFKENTEVLWADLANTVTNMLEEFEDTVEEANNEMLIQIEGLKNNMVGDNGALTQIGSSADTMTGSLNDAADAVVNLRNETKELYDLFGSDSKQLEDALTKITEYEDQLKSTTDTTSSLRRSLIKANQAITSKTAEAENYKTALDFATGAKQIKAGSIVKLKKGTYVNYDRHGGSQQDDKGHTGWKLPMDMWVKFTEPIAGVEKPYGFYATGESLQAFGKKIGNYEGGSDSRGGVAPENERHHQHWWFDQQELQKNVLDAMDTGGYTGEWNEKTPLWKDGKIAMLHQKELVLNATDTQNILAAVELMRNMTNSITSFSNIGFNSGASSSYNPITEQRVEIQASFPNATDAEDIRQALIGLSDKAYQYARRTI